MGFMEVRGWAGGDGVRGWAGEDLMVAGFRAGRVVLILLICGRKKGNISLSESFNFNSEKLGAVGGGTSVSREDCLLN